MFSMNLLQNSDRKYYFCRQHETMDFNRRAKKRKLKEMFDSNESVDFNLNKHTMPDEQV